MNVPDYAVYPSKVYVRVIGQHANECVKRLNPNMGFVPVIKLNDEIVRRIEHKDVPKETRNEITFHAENSLVSLMKGEVEELAKEMHALSKLTGDAPKDMVGIAVSSDKVEKFCAGMSPDLVAMTQNKVNKINHNIASAFGLTEDHEHGRTLDM